MNDNQPFAEPTLEQGDVLLYRPGNLRNGVMGWFFGLLITLKTWTRISHAEVYIGDNQAMASRDGKGVAKYPLRRDGLAYVLRPKAAPDMLQGFRWFYSNANGQKYDWMGILVFTLAVKQGAKDRMYCSEFACRFYRDGFGVPLFADTWDSDRTPPSMLLSSLALSCIWHDGKGL